jgi:AcrR family transcriptional regulator
MATETPGPTELQAAAVARGRPRDPALDAAIHQAALELIAEIGYERMTIDALASRAGVSKPTIYRRWPGGKAEVTVAAMRAFQAQRAPLPDTGALRSDLMAAIGCVCAEKREQAGLTAGLSTQLRSDPELLELVRGQLIDGERARMRPILERAEARGEIADVAAVSPLFVDVALSMLHTRLGLSGEPVDDQFVAELVDHILLPILTPTK